MYWMALAQSQQKANEQRSGKELLEECLKLLGGNLSYDCVSETKSIIKTLLKRIESIGDGDESEDSEG